jgi:hypothetical protein
MSEGSAAALPPQVPIQSYFLRRLANNSRPSIPASGAPAAPTMHPPPPSPPPLPFFTPALCTTMLNCSVSVPLALVAVPMINPVGPMSPLPGIPLIVLPDWLNQPGRPLNATTGVGEPLTWSV